MVCLTLLVPVLGDQARAQRYQYLGECITAERGSMGKARIALLRAAWSKGSADPDWDECISAGRKMDSPCERRGIVSASGNSASVTANSASPPVEGSHDDQSSCSRDSRIRREHHLVISLRPRRVE